MGFKADLFRSGTALVLAAGLAVTPAAVAQTRAPQRARSANARGIAGRGYLGVGVAELTDDRVKALNLKNDQGVEVKHVEEKSPAANAGLKENDVILEVNGKPVEDIQQFQTTIAESAPGSKVGLTVWRNGAKQNLSATLDQRPNGFVFVTPNLPDDPMPPAPPMPPVPFGNGSPFPAMPGNSPVVGFEGETLSPQLAQYFGVREGVLVRTVNPQTPAERAGLKAGDVVTKVNGTPVMSPHEITGLVRSGGRNRKAISFTVVRNKKEISVNVEISGNRLPNQERQDL